MTRIVADLANISAGYDAVYCDLWGCLHDGVRAFPPAISALRKFREAGGIVILLTNSPRPRDQVALQLAGFGAPRDCWDDIATSGDSAQAAMAAGVVGRRVFHLGPARDAPFFTDLPADVAAEPVERVPLEEAGGVVCTGLVDDATEAPEAYRPVLLEAKARGLKLLCANPDIVVDKGGRRLWCAGALARLYTEMGGESLYFGKPHAPIYDLARRRLAALAQVPDDRILAIGDGVGTDIAGAVGEGLDCLFVAGGLAAEEVMQDGVLEPSRIDAFLARHKTAAPFAIDLLR